MCDKTLIFWFLQKYIRIHYKLSFSIFIANNKSTCCLKYTATENTTKIDEKSVVCLIDNSGYLLIHSINKKAKQLSSDMKRKPIENFYLLPYTCTFQLILPIRSHNKIIYNTYKLIILIVM